MADQLSRPLVLDPHDAVDPCTTCEARTLGVCDAIPDADLTRLSSIVVVTEVAAGQGFIDEGESPADAAR